MALTPSGGLTSWITAASFFVFCDVRAVATLLKDDGLAADPVSLRTDGTPENGVLLKFLQAACGKLESHLLRGNRYQAADLAGLPAGSNAAAYRDELLAKIAMQAMFRRRPSLLPDYKAIAGEAEKTLQALADGQAIFPFGEVQDAGVMTSVPETAADVTARRLTSVQAERYFGVRGNRLTGPDPC